MFGNLLSSVIKIATLPVDAAEIAVDAITGGTGDRRDLKNSLPLPLPSELRDKLADAAKEIDE
jgi:hypothetical protein